MYPKLLDRLIALSAAAFAGSVALVAPVQNRIGDPRPAISATTTRSFEATALYPGGPPAQSDVVVRYSGAEPAAVHLRVADLVGAGPPTASLCQSSQPAGEFLFRVSSAGATLYRGGLADLPVEGVAIPGAAPTRRWSPGEQHLVQLAVSLAGSADDDYMGCGVEARFFWTAE